MPDPVCPNCGTIVEQHYCPNCGQKRAEGLPTVWETVHEIFGAVFSYDGKLWRTLKCLLMAPGQLTVEYVNGRRASFLGPWQLFLWLQAITFAIHQTLFDPSAQYTHNKSLAILGLGFVLAIALWASEARRRSGFTHALLTASHIWSFLMVVLLVEYAIAVPLGNLLIRHGLLNPDFPIGKLVTLVAMTAMEPYLLLSLKRVYQRPWTTTILQWIWLNFAVILSMFALQKYL